MSILIVQTKYTPICIDIQSGNSPGTIAEATYIHNLFIFFRYSQSVPGTINGASLLAAIANARQERVKKHCTQIFQLPKLQIERFSSSNLDMYLKESSIIMWIGRCPPYTFRLLSGDYMLDFTHSFTESPGYFLGFTNNSAVCCSKFWKWLSLWKFPTPKNIYFFRKVIHMFCDYNPVNSGYIFKRNL